MCKNPNFEMLRPPGVVFLVKGGSEFSQRGSQMLLYSKTLPKWGGSLRSVIPFVSCASASKLSY